MSSSKIQFSETIEVADRSSVPGGSRLDTSRSQCQIKLLYDGECPLCMREVNFLRKRDAGRGLVRFVDIAESSYAPSEHGGVDFEAAMGRIHALLPDGTVIKNVEVFRRVYEILGMGWIYAATKLPIIGFIVDKLYELWADWRLTATGRPNLETIVAERQKRIECQTLERCRLQSKVGVGGAECGM